MTMGLKESVLVVELFTENKEKIFYLTAFSKTQTGTDDKLFLIIVPQQLYFLEIFITTLFMLL